MTYPPVGSKRLCECGACHRGFTSTAAFDAHRQAFRCLEPSSIGLWLATDGLWSLEPRDPEVEASNRRHRGFALAARKDQEDPRALGITPAEAARVPGGGSALTDVSDAMLREVV